MQEDYAEMIAAIRGGSRSHLHTIYLEHRDSFLEWAQARFRCSKEDALDVYQDVIIVFYENIVDGKVQQLRSQLRTYLFGIGRNLLIKRFKENQRLHLMGDDGSAAEWPEGPEGDIQLELNDRQRLLREVIGLLGEKCRDLLLLYYYRQYSTEAIIEELGYKNPDVVKSQKARCLRSIRERFEQQLTKDLK
jgi:RNA polymerase sigma-70 factor (ECF subfamily)